MSTIKKYGVVVLKSESGRGSVPTAGSDSTTGAVGAVDKGTAVDKGPEVCSTVTFISSPPSPNIFLKSASKAEARALEGIGSDLGI